MIGPFLRCPTNAVIAVSKNFDAHLVVFLNVKWMKERKMQISINLMVGGRNCDSLQRVCRNEQIVRLTFSPALVLDKWTILQWIPRCQRKVCWGRQNKEEMIDQFREQEKKVISAYLTFSCRLIKKGSGESGSKSVLMSTADGILTSCRFCGIVPWLRHQDLGESRPLHASAKPTTKDAPEEQWEGEF